MPFDFKECAVYDPECWLLSRRCARVAACGIPVFLKLDGVAGREGLPPKFGMPLGTLDGSARAGDVERGYDSREGDNDVSRFLSRLESIDIGAACEGDGACSCSAFCLARPEPIRECPECEEGILDFAVIRSDVDGLFDISCGMKLSLADVVIVLAVFPLTDLLLLTAKTPALSFCFCPSTIASAVDLGFCWRFFAILFVGSYGGE
jgi:hypothetical protein